MSSVPALPSVSAGACGSGTVTVVWAGGVWSLSAVAVFVDLPAFEVGLRQRVAARADDLRARRERRRLRRRAHERAQLGSATVTPVSVTLPLLVAVSV